MGMFASVYPLHKAVGMEWEITELLMTCSDEDNEDIPYLRKVFEFIEANDDKFDASRIYAEGGSQNSVFSAYLAFCFRFKSSTYLLLTKMLSANCLIFPSFFGSCFTREFFP